MIVELSDGSLHFSILEDIISPRITPLEIKRILDRYPSEVSCEVFLSVGDPFIEDIKNDTIENDVNKKRLLSSLWEDVTKDKKYLTFFYIPDFNDESLNNFSYLSVVLSDTLLEIVQEIQNLKVKVFIIPKAVIWSSLSKFINLPKSYKVIDFGLDAKVFSINSKNILNDSKVKHLLSDKEIFKILNTKTPVECSEGLPVEVLRPVISEIERSLGERVLLLGGPVSSVISYLEDTGSLISYDDLGLDSYDPVFSEAPGMVYYLLECIFLREFVKYVSDNNVFFSGNKNSFSSIEVRKKVSLGKIITNMFITTFTVYLIFSSIIASMGFASSEYKKLTPIIKEEGFSLDDLDLKYSELEKEIETFVEGKGDTLSSIFYIKRILSLYPADMKIVRIKCISSNYAEIYTEVENISVLTSLILSLEEELKDRDVEISYYSSETEKEVILTLTRKSEGY